MLWEFLSLAVSILVLWALREFRIRPAAPRLTRLLHGTERRAVVTLLLAGFVAAWLSSVVRPPAPLFHDEFSYLLGADTFSHGRLTNATHPLWRHFETFHVLQQPSYQSKYPPAQAVFIAVGQISMGRPIAGVWLSVALTCAALYWCLRPWMPRRWAFFGGLFPAIVFGTGFFTAHLYYAYWSTTFWGGAVTMLGACLLLGSVVRIIKGRPAKPALLGLGLAILAATRPYEGVLLSVPALAMAYCCRRPAVSLTRALGPAIAVFAAASCLSGYYNWRVVGSPFEMPYQTYTRIYDSVPLFRFQERSSEPPYRHEILRAFQLDYQRSIAEWNDESFTETLARAARLAIFFLGAPLSLAAILGFVVWRGRWAALARGLLLVGMLSHTLTWLPMLFPHYFAPFVPLAILMSLRGLRTIRLWGRRAGSGGRMVAQGAVSATAAVFAVSLVSQSQSTFPLNDFAVARVKLQAGLEAREGKQLVVVRYAPTHFVHHEWVYNRADIDGSKVVWAREMSPSENEELLKYFSDRQAWLFEPDSLEPRLRPYSQ